MIAARAAIFFRSRRGRTPSDTVFFQSLSSHRPLTAPACRDVQDHPPVIGTHAREPEVQSVSGHSTSAMVRRYSATYDSAQAPRRMPLPARRRACSNSNRLSRASLLASGPEANGGLVRYHLLGIHPPLSCVQGLRGSRREREAERDVPNAQLRRPVHGLGIAIVLVAVVAAACGSDDGDNGDRSDRQAAVAESPGTATSDEASTTVEVDYGEAIGAINARLETRSEEIFAPLNQAFATLSPEGVLGVLADAVPLAIAATEDSLRELRALTPPDQFAADHARLIEGWEDIVALYDQSLEAAQARDVVRAQELQDRIFASTRSLRSDLSEEFSQYVFTSEQSAALSALFGSLSDAEVLYLDGLRAGMREFGRRSTAFSQAVSMRFADQPAFFEALLAADVGKAFAAAQTEIVKLEAPPTYAADHGRVLALFDELVRIDQEIGAAVASADMVGFLVGSARLGHSVARAQLEIAPEVADALFPGSGPNLIRLRDRDFDSAYEADLYALLLEYRLHLGGATGARDFSFAPTTEADEFAALGLIQPEIIAVIEEAMRKLTALEPTPELRADHDRLVRYLSDALEVSRSILTAAAARDAAGLQAGMGRAVRVFCDTARDLTAAIDEVRVAHFNGPPNDPDLMKLCGQVAG